jgi:hypothetical protein
METKIIKSYKPQAVSCELLAIAASRRKVQEGRSG